MYRVRPSALHRTVACPGSLTMSERYPETEPKPAAEEGIAAHWAATECLKHRRAAQSAAYPVSAWAGCEAPNGVIVDEEMVESAEVFVEYVTKLATDADAWQTLQIEEELPIRWIHPTACGGTPDVRLLEPETGRLHIVDYKHGHRYVEEFENPQLVAYAAGALELLTTGRHFTDANFRPVLTIVQPRCYSGAGPVRSWTPAGGGAALRPQVNTMAHQVGLALGDDPQLVAGPQCFECPAAAFCPAASRQASAAMEYVLQAIPEEPTPEQLGVELALLSRAEDALKARKDALEAQATAALKRGDRVPGWLLEGAYGRKAWQKPPAEVACLGELYGIELRKTDALITPGQAVKAGLPEEVVDAYSFTPSRGVKLRPDSQTHVKKVFSQ